MPSTEPTFTTVLSTLRSLGAPPLGSPADIRAQATRLRAIAEGLGSSQALLASASAMRGAEGPGARRSRAAIAHQGKMLDVRVQGIDSLAARLDAAAASLEARQGEWNAAFHGRAAGLPGYLVNQAVGHLGWKLS